MGYEPNPSSRDKLSAMDQDPGVGRLPSVRVDDTVLEPTYDNCGTLGVEAEANILSGRDVEAQFSDGGVHGTIFENISVPPLQTARNDVESRSGLSRQPTPAGSEARAAFQGDRGHAGFPVEAFGNSPARLSTSLSSMERGRQTARSRASHGRAPSSEDQKIDRLTSLMKSMMVRMERMEDDRRSRRSGFTPHTSGSEGSHQWEGFGRGFRNLEPDAVRFRPEPADPNPQPSYPNAHCLAGPMGDMMPGWNPRESLPMAGQYEAFDAALPTRCPGTRSVLAAIESTDAKPQVQGPYWLPSGAQMPGTQVQGPSSLPSGAQMPGAQVQGPSSLPSGTQVPGAQVQGPSSLPSGTQVPDAQVQVPSLLPSGVQVQGPSLLPSGAQSQGAQVQGPSSLPLNLQVHGLSYPPSSAQVLSSNAQARGPQEALPFGIQTHQMHEEAKRWGTRHGNETNRQTP